MAPTLHDSAPPLLPTGSHAVRTQTVEVLPRSMPPKKFTGIQLQSHAVAPGEEHYVLDKSLDEVYFALQ